MQIIIGSYYDNVNNANPNTLVVVAFVSFSSEESFDILSALSPYLLYFPKIFHLPFVKTPLYLPNKKATNLSNVIKYLVFLKWCVE